MSSCLNCNAELNQGRNCTGKYCNNKCQRDHKTKLINLEVAQGKAANSGQVKKYLLATVGNVCSECGISDWQGKSIVMELEHKNGHSEDNTLENCCLLCPNCHSQTPTYKNRNMGNGRHARRVRYAEGKSY